jgi:hypothetical protein
MKPLNFFRKIETVLTGVIFFSLVFSNRSDAQDLFVVGSNNDLYELNSDNTLEYIGMVNTTIVTGDIAIAPNGTLYGLKNGFLPNPEIIQIDISTNSTTVIGVFPIPTSSFSLVCGNDNELYALGSNFELWKYNLTTGVSTYIDNLGTDSPGDITFYKGNIIFQNSAGGNIMAYNLENGNLRTILCKRDDNPIWGISNRFTDCGNETIIATDYANNFYELDFSAGSFIPINVDHSILPPGVQVNGMASGTEHLGLLCPRFDFADVNCAISVNELTVPGEEIHVYPNPVARILNFSSSKEVQSIRVYDISGKQLTVFEHPADHVDLNFAAPGIYYLKFEVGNTSVVKKIHKI